MDRLRTRPPPLCSYSLRSPPDNPWHQGAAGCSQELLDFHRQHFYAGHLFVKELHHPGQFVRDAISYEQQAQAGGPQVVIYRFRSIVAYGDFTTGG